MNTMNTTPSNEPILLRPADAAATLGISRSKLARLRKNNELPVVMIGRQPRYPLDALRAWVAARRLPCR